MSLIKLVIAAMCWFFVALRVINKCGIGSRLARIKLDGVKVFQRVCDVYNWVYEHGQQWEKRRIDDLTDKERKKEGGKLLWNDLTLSFARELSPGEIKPGDCTEEKSGNLWRRRRKLVCLHKKEEEKNGKRMKLKTKECSSKWLHSNQCL